MKRSSRVDESKRRVATVLAHGCGASHCFESEYLVFLQMATLLPMATSILLINTTHHVYKVYITINVQLVRGLIKSLIT